MLTMTSPPKPTAPPLEKWKCRKPSCKKTLMEHSVTEGTVMKICERCGTVNTLVDGRPQL